MEKILLVDDEPQIIRALGRLLKHAGYEVEQASSGREALEKLSAFGPDLVISDFRMPNMNGAELLAEVKRRRPLTLRLILSGYADLRSILTSINEGEICRFLTKPWDDEELVMLLKKLLGERDLLNELYRPFREPPPGVSSEMSQLESKLVVRLQGASEPVSNEQVIALLAKFTGALEESQLQVIGGILERHGGRLSFVANIGSNQQLTLEVPVSGAELDASTPGTQ